MMRSICVVVLLLSACSQHQDLYYWGRYQSSVFKVEQNKNNDPYKQIALLEADVQRSKAKQLALPPGFYAHLALLYDQVGQRQQAINALQTEKRLFPDSAAMVDQLLQTITNTDTAKPSMPSGQSL